MPDIWMITGGGRSGKSAYAESLATGAVTTGQEMPESLATGADASGPKSLAAGQNTRAAPGVLYIATAAACDDEMEERIAKHRAVRPGNWTTWERHRELSDIGQEFSRKGFGTILLDCVGNLLMGILFDEIPDADACTLAQFESVEQLSIAEIDTLCAYAQGHKTRLIFVTNEVGMGIIPETRYARCYRDALGRINKHIAEKADRVVLMVAGIPMTLK